MGTGCEAPAAQTPSGLPIDIDGGQSQPPSEADRLLIAHFIDSLAPGSKADPKKYLSGSFLATPSANSCMGAVTDLVRQCRRGPPTSLGQIRVMWDCGRRYPYLLFFATDSGRISNMVSIDTPIPMLSPVRAMRTGPDLITSADYPVEAVRNGWEGTTDFDLTIAPNGGVAYCAVTHSSGHAVLDDAACQLIVNRALFQQISYANGHPVMRHWSSSVNWRLPKAAAPTMLQGYPSETARPKSAGGYLARGETRLNRLDIDAAIADFDAALAIDPSLTHAVGDRGVAYAWKGAHSEALRDLDALAAVEPNTPVEYRGRGLLAQTERRNQDAYAYFSRAIAIYPEPFAIGHRAEVDRLIGNNDLALTDAANALKLEPKSPILYQIRADILRERGDGNAAMAEAAHLAIAMPDAIMLG